MTSVMNSPQGGTTSLPQYLQKRQPATGQPAQMQPFAGALQNTAAQPKPATQPTTAAPTASPTPKPAAGGMTAPTTLGAPSQPGMWAYGNQAHPIPAPPPPPAAPAPATPATPTPQVDSKPPAAPSGPLSGLPSYIQQMLDHPGAYDNPTIDAMRQSGMNNLEDLRRSEEDRLKSDFAGRGMLRSTGLNTSLGDLSERYVRGAQDLEADLMDKSAQSRQSGLLSAIQAAMGFGHGQIENQQAQTNALIALAQLGMLGGPTIPGAVGDYNSMPLPTPGDNSWIYQILGGMYPGKAGA